MWWFLHNAESLDSQEPSAANCRFSKGALEGGLGVRLEGGLGGAELWAAGKGEIAGVEVGYAAVYRPKVLGGTERLSFA